MSASSKPLPRWEGAGSNGRTFITYAPDAATARKKLAEYGVTEVTAVGPIESEAHGPLVDKSPGAK
jgi:hypothetical protein